MIGRTFSHYTIQEKLGEGGMGVVYKAEDTKLDRIVALKFLPIHLEASEQDKARFLQEAKAAAALNHPNVCSVIDIQEQDGQQFIVMEYIDGETLRRKIPLARTDDAVRYAIQIGEALQEAHSKGIVHRDVKCENILVTSRNQIKVMDFGLAKLKGSLKLTKTSSTVGTLAYMAPEQIQGGETDARSDIFSFGVVLFEMLTGRTPFRGEHEAAIMYSIVNEEPDSVLKFKPDLSPELDRIIRRSLEKDPEDRYQHIDDMVSELRRLQKQSTRVVRPTLKEMPVPPSGVFTHQTQEHRDLSAKISPPVVEPKQKLPLVLGGAAILVVVSAVVAYFLFFAAHESIDSIAVLPFENVGADPNTQYLSDGITESLINSLSQLSNLTVMSRSSVFHYKGKEVDPQEAGKKLGVKAILTGRVTPHGEDIQISTELVDVARNSHIWGEQYNRKLADLLAIQQEISKEISEKLSLKLAGEEERKLEKASTGNTEAYQLYLKGRYLWNKRKADDLKTAIDYYNQAIQKDPNYALAYAGLASTYALLPEYAGASPNDILPKAQAAATKASELDPTLAEPRAVLGLLKLSYRWDREGAEKEFRQAIQLNPNYPTVHHWYSISLRQEGKLDESMAEIKKAQELDPLSPVINLNVAEVLLLLHRPEEAIDQLKKTIELDPIYPGAHMSLGLMYSYQGRFDEALNELKKAREILGPDDPLGLGPLGNVYARAGKKQEALKILNQLQTLSEHRSNLALQAAMVYTGLEDKDKAFEWLEKAYDQQNQALGNLKITQLWETLRSDPRFSVLLKKVRLEN